MPSDAFRRGLSVADAIAAEHGIELSELRRFAAACLSELYSEKGITDGDIGSSDVSIALSRMALDEPELLRAEAARVRERNELLSSMAAATGRTPEEVLSSLQRLLAPPPPKV